MCGRKLVWICLRWACLLVQGWCYPTILYRHWLISPYSAAYMRQWTGSALVQVMACRLYGTKPLPEPMLAYCQLDSWEQISAKFESEFYHFHSRKCIWNCRLPKWRPFCSGGDELTHRSLDIMVDMLLTAYWITIPRQKIVFWIKFLSHCLFLRNRQIIKIGSGHDFAPYMRQAITWTNAAPIHGLISQ